MNDAMIVSERRAKAWAGFLWLALCLLLVSNLAYLATGKFPFAGAAQAEAKLTDSMTGQVLGLAVDRQIGGGSVEAGFQGQWGDAENAINAWCKQLADRLSSWMSGSATP